MIILADDLGFSDLGCYGSEIATPNLNALAESGLRYSNFYNTGRCWPTRAALLTGYYPQQVNADALPATKKRGYRKRPAWAPLLSERLAAIGYHSYHAGKWHMAGTPLTSGFERSYWLKDHNRFFSPQKHLLDDQPLPASTEDEYYATTKVASQAIEFLQHHRREHADAPFFTYVAFTSPHFPLQAPAEDIARYADQYATGWDKVRTARWGRMQSMNQWAGNLSNLEPQIGPPYHFPKALEILGTGEVNRELAWQSLSDQQQKFQAAKMAIHAAMIDRMDQEIGRICDELKRTGQFENTLILFVSDNGASAEIMVRGDGHDPAEPAGSAGSYLCLGPGWSSAANTPFRRHKTWVHEGGIATPLITHWPAGIRSKGQWQNRVGHVIDIAPTIAELAGESSPQYQSETTAPPSPGRSLVSSFESKSDSPRDPLWWLHEGNRAYREGDWKLVAAKGDPWELYDLSKDRAENNNLAHEFPEKVEQLQEKWQAMTAEFEELERQQR